MKPATVITLLVGAATNVVVAANVKQQHHARDWDLSQPMNGVSFERIKAVTAAKPDGPTARFSRLKRIGGSKGKGKAVAISALGRALDASPHTTSKHGFQNISSVGAYATQYAIQCGWDGKPVWLLFDTGSSDTWAAKSDFECIDSVGVVHEQSACGFGSWLVDDFGQGEIDDLHFFLKYGSGERISGPMGYSDVSCGGVSVSKQQVGLANSTYWRGNNDTVGILGLAYPSITSAFYGAIGDEASWNSVTYTPFLTNAIIQGGLDPVFSVALSKNSSDGILAWGGLPPIDWQRGSYAWTDLIVANLVDEAEAAWKYSFYTIVPDGVRWGQTKDTTKFPFIVDTGTTMMYLPPPLAETIAMSFQPRAVYLYQWGMYFAPCDAIPPRFAVTISGVDFWVKAVDMIYKDLVDPLTGYCAISVASGGKGPYILGDAFLQNVVAVFDVGAAQMRFYAR